MPQLTPAPLTNLPIDEPDTLLTLAIAWGEAVVRQISVARSAQAEYHNAIRAADRAEDWSPTDVSLHERFRNVWTAHSTLVWMSFQLERWTHRLYSERGRESPTSLPLLRNLRNALEHLDEAILDGSFARPGHEQQANRSLRELPNSELLIGTHGERDRLFGLIAIDDIEKAATCLLAAISREVDECCADQYADDFE